ncbi:MAG: FAD-dependent thymidylate synthase [Thermoplasmata archaeon]
MKIIRKGKFEILTSKKDLLRQLKTIERAGRTSHRSEKEEVTNGTATKFIKKIIDLGHESVLEHGYMSVRFTNVSRGFTHEMVRHRHCAFTQESTRYVNYFVSDKNRKVQVGKKEIEFVFPPREKEDNKITLKNGKIFSISEFLNLLGNFYEALLDSGWRPEDARQFLPIGISSQIIVTTNLREWRQIFERRTTLGAHWEIRRIIAELLEKVREEIPIIFDDFVKEGEDNHGIPYYTREIKM